MASRRQKVNLPDIDDDEDHVFTIESILNKRRRGTKIEYLIKWAGRAEEEATWEPEENVSCPELIAEFLRKMAEEKKFEENLPTSSTRYYDNKKLLSIEGATNIPGELHFYCKFSTDTATLLPAKEVNMRWPDQVIRFYQSRVKFTDSTIESESIPR